MSIPYGEVRSSTGAYHFTLLDLGLGLSRYFTAATDACASAKDGAFSPMRAYSSREMPSGFLCVDTDFRGKIEVGTG